MAHTNSGAVVYRLYNADGDLLYVGSSIDFDFRTLSHRSTQPWWSEVATFSTAPFATREEAFAHEKLIINQENPRYNLMRYPIEEASPYRFSLYLDPSLAQLIRDLSGGGYGAMSEWVREAITEKLANVKQAELDDHLSEYRDRMETHKRFIANTGGPYIG